MKLGWKGLLGIVVSVVLIWWTLKDVAFSDVWEATRQGNAWLLAASVAVATLGFLLRALRWQVLLRPLKADTSLDSRFGAISIGFMANNLLPARMGEFVRVYAFSRMEALSMSGIFGTLVVERFLDGLVLMGFLVLPMVLPGFPAAEEVRDGNIATAVQGILIALLLIVLFLGALLLWPERVIRVTERVAVRLPERIARRAVDALVAFMEALEVLRSPLLFSQALLWSVVFWGWHAIAFYLAMAAFGIHEGFAAALFTEAAVGFGVALPAAPGFFGTFHAAAAWALTNVYGAVPAQSLAFAYGFHLGGFIPITLIGLWYARRIGLSLSEMQRSEERVERDVEVTHPEAADLLAGRKGGGGAPAPVPRTPSGGAGATPVVPTPPPGGADPGEALVEVGRAVELDAPAKVNLLLRVLAREPSGYHRIETLFQALEWGDRVRVEVCREGEGVRLEVEGLAVGPVEDNLVHRAATSFLAAAGVAAGVRIRLTKRIPPGSGLGGGSSDGAATLRALSALFGHPLPDARLAELAEELGSDVPFFLCGSPLALAWGRGERLRELPPLPAAPVIVALSAVHVSTAQAYASLARPVGERTGGAGVPAPAVPGPGDWTDVSRISGNDFEELVLGRHPEVARAYEALEATAPRFLRLSGSGSAVFAVYGDEASAARAMRRLEERGGDVVFVSTRTRTAVSPIENA